MNRPSMYGPVAFSISLIGLLALVLLPSFTAPITLTGLALTLIFVGFACDATATLKDRDPAPASTMIAWLAFGAFTLSLLAREHTLHGVQRLVVWMACICGCTTLRNRVRGARQRQVLLQCVLLLFVALAFRALAERFYLYSTLREMAQGLGFQATSQEAAGFFASSRAKVTFGQANGFAGFVLLLLPIILILATNRKTQKISWLFLALNVLCLWASGSKGGTLVFVAILGICLCFWFEDPRLRLGGKILIGIAGIGAVICILSLFDGLLPARLDALFETFQLRHGYWSTALNMFSSKAVLGVGAGLFGESFYLHASSATSFSRYAHNGYLGIAAEFGAIGIAMVSLLLWKWSRLPSVTHHAEKEENTAPRFPFEFAIAFLVAAPTYSLNLLAQGGWWTSLLTLLPLTLLLDKFFVRRLVAEGLGNHHHLRRVAFVATLAFLLHSLVDFDVQITGVTATLALILAIGGREKIQVSARPKLAVASFMLGMALALFWSLGPQATQLTRLGPIELQTLSAWPVDLRALFAEADRTNLTPMESRALTQEFEKLDSSFGHLPAFQKRMEMLKQK